MQSAGGPANVKLVEMKSRSSSSWQTMNNREQRSVLNLHIANVCSLDQYLWVVFKRNHMRNHFCVSITMQYSEQTGSCRSHQTHPSTSASPMARAHRQVGAYKPHMHGLPD